MTFTYKTWTSTEAWLAMDSSHGEGSKPPPNKEVSTFLTMVATMIVKSKDHPTLFIKQTKKI